MKQDTHSLPFDFRDFPEAEGWTHKEFRYGSILYRDDQSVTALSLARYGEYKEHELSLLRQLLKPGNHVVETASHFGEHAIALGRHVGSQGSVLAMSTDPVEREGLEYNVKNNAMANVLVRQGDLVADSSLDILHLRKCDLVKIGSGNGNDILDKGRDLLLRLRPFLYVRNDQSPARSRDMIGLLFHLGYALWWHPVSLYNSDNFYQEPENIFGQLITINMLGVPRETTLNINLPQVTGETDYWWRLISP